MEAAAAAEGQPCFAPKGSLRWNARQLLEQGDVQSIRELADRFDGKAVQSLEVGKPGDFEQMSDAELEAFIASRENRASRSSSGNGKAPGNEGVRGKPSGVH